MGEPPGRPRQRLKLVRAVPLVIVAAIGAFFWRGGLGLLPVEREITWRLWGDAASVRRVEVQLYDGDLLLERSQLETPGGATFEPTMKLSLKEGTYRGLVMVWRADAGAPEVHDQKVTVDETSTALTVP